MYKKILLFICFFIPLFTVNAEYILPYPGPMPGNKMYTLVKMIDKFQYYWFWGSIAKANYFMDLSDKYLVESKVLFEYKQYLLAVDALKRSDESWEQIDGYISRAAKEGKNIQYLQTKHQEQSVEHKQSIDRLMTMLPETFNWTPENEKSTNIQLKQLLENSKNIRNSSQ